MGTIAILALGAFVLTSRGQQAVTLLRIGSSGSLITAGKSGQETAALGTLQNFIKTETGLNNEIIRQKNWRELAEKMASKEFHLGVFQGYEFAWAQEKYPALKPLALAINVHRYSIAYVITAKTSSAGNFAGLQGQALAITGADGFLRIFIERQCQALGKKPEEFFSRVTTPENVEDALDDAVDGKVQAVAVDRAGLEAYKRRKPGRFNQLKPVAQSKPFPPVVVAHYDEALDGATLQRFRDGLLNASQKESGQTLLTLFKLTKFEAVPADFERVLADTRAAYPPPANDKAAPRSNGEK